LANANVFFCQGEIYLVDEIEARLHEIDSDLAFLPVPTEPLED
jgi:hypothetical protein